MRAAVLSSILALASCAEEAPFQARFAVRGRWTGERELRLFAEDDVGPVRREAFLAALDEALAGWRASGLVTGSRVEREEEANVVLGWRRGAHAGCASFGADPSVAHAGPVGPGTFVHFDAGRTWSAPGDEREGGLSLAQAALHELGHVLGLDHSPDETSVLYPDPAQTRARLGRSDLAGLQALYGGPSLLAGSLEILTADGEHALSLPEVAPHALCSFDVFDVDGDGDDELLVWRTDADPQAGGALWQYHFEPGPVLARTVGPLYGVSAPNTRLAFARAADGTRLFALRNASSEVVRHFDAHGLPAELELVPPHEFPPERKTPEECRADLDADGREERVLRVIER